VIRAGLVPNMAHAGQAMAGFGRTPWAIGLSEATKGITTNCSREKERDDSELKGKRKSGCSPPCWVAVSSKGARPAVEICFGPHPLGPSPKATRHCAGQERSRR
jgi:hypothetical protein